MRKISCFFFSPCIYARLSSPVQSMSWAVISRWVFEQVQLVVVLCVVLGFSILDLYRFYVRCSELEWFDTRVTPLQPRSPSSGSDSPTSSAYDTTDGSNSILIASVWSMFPIQTSWIPLCLAGRHCVRKMCSTPQKQSLILHGHGWRNSYDHYRQLLVVNS
ncbi:hypothetical protein BKA82DRAFT_295066 [Pisolithus tinctorius]|uniref:Uncharacterized protein n=1 Tax=Pisolithus tinctorius Marx 270 TaxID=870435 RepID=A0A0C3JE68_PISTI|nr:hypothetical protein BKA82DRAFT_295066 [Pisolithus tinctorius]KIN95921.1 hypothetical protein M404DRAFT_295066 [Pisolithus tinctorius Marx 270]